jgi:hypothetical protein
MVYISHFGTMLTELRNNVPEFDEEEREALERSYGSD